MSGFMHVYSDDTFRKEIDARIEGIRSLKGAVDDGGFPLLTDADEFSLSHSVRMRDLWNRLFGEVIHPQLFDNFEHFPLPPGWSAFRKPRGKYPQSPELMELDKWIDQFLERSIGKATRHRLERIFRCPYFWMRWVIFYAHGVQHDNVDAFYILKFFTNERNLRRDLAKISKNLTIALDSLSLISSIVDQRKIDLYNFPPEDDFWSPPIFLDGLRVDERICENKPIDFTASEVFDLMNIRRHIAFFQALEAHCDRRLEQSADKGGAVPVWRRYAFAAHMAAAYYFLTGERPTSSPEGNFARFLQVTETVYWCGMDPAERFPENSSMTIYDYQNKDLVDKTVKIFRTIDFRVEAKKNMAERHVNSFEDFILPTTIRKFRSAL
ncbi:MAG: hypothetical protein ACK4K8_10500 [Pannonibacter sp.]